MQTISSKKGSQVPKVNPNLAKNWQLLPSELLAQASTASGGGVPPTHPGTEGMEVPGILPVGFVPAPVVSMVMEGSSAFGFPLGVIFTFPLLTNLT